MFFLDVPKADCHIHANAMAVRKDVEELARKYRVTLPHPPYIEADGSRRWDPEDHSSFHHAYDATVWLVREPEDIKTIVKRALIRMHGQRCIYAELLASGLNNFRGGDPAPVFAQNMRALAAAIREAHAETGIHAFISLTAKRHLKDGVKAAHQLLDVFEAFRKSDPEDAFFITGFNMAGNEERANNRDFHPVFERASYSLNLGCACHAGEVRSADDIWEAIALPGVTRVGHALSAIHDPGLMRELAGRQIMVEQLLTMNETLRRDIMQHPEGHPIRRYHEAGICLGLGSDDPGMLDEGCSIGTEYAKAAEKYGFSSEDLLGFTASSIRHAFAPLEIKEKLLRRLGSFASENGLSMPPERFEIARGGRPGAFPRAALA